MVERRDQILMISLRPDALRGSRPWPAYTRRRTGLSRWNEPYAQPFPLLRPTDDKAIRPLVHTSLVALGRLAPRRHGMTATGGATLAATMRMVDRVHHHTTLMRLAARASANALLYRYATGSQLSGLETAPIVAMHSPRTDAKLARHQLYLGVAAILADQLSELPCGACNLAAGRLASSRCCG